jgi:hypothetical protein
MQLLLSLCNQPRPAHQGALLFDSADKSGSWIPVGTEAEIMGTRGICLHGGILYVCYTVGWWETHVSIYELGEGRPRLLGDSLLPEVRDPHSVCVYDEHLLIASTGTDEIVAYDLSGGEVGDIAETFWRASFEGSDTHHVNSVYSDGRRVIVSAFGLRSGEFWSSAQNGYIRDVTSGRTLVEGLRHPHSVRIHGDQVYFTESSTQTLREVGAEAVVIGGYARGCDVAPDDSILVGSNAARRLSRSRGVVTNSGNVENDEGDVVGKCSIAHVKLSAGRALRTYYDITPFGKEIYDIRVLG